MWRAGKLVLAAGMIPDVDIPDLEGLGIAAVFPPGSIRVQVDELIKTPARH